MSGLKALSVAYPKSVELARTGGTFVSAVAARARDGDVIHSNRVKSEYADVIVELT